MGKWRLPFDGELVPHLDGQQFGMTGYQRPGGTYFHDGYDFGTIPYKARNNGKILAVNDGEITDKGIKGGGIGSYIILRAGGYNIMYQEFGTDGSGIDVNVGDKVKAGQPIAHFTNGSHLHIGFTKKDINVALGSWDKDDGTWEDPIPILKSGGSAPNPDPDPNPNPKPTPSGKEYPILKVNSFQYPLVRECFIQLDKEKKDKAFSKYQLLREGLTKRVGTYYPEVMAYINSLQGKYGLEKLCCAPFTQLTLTNGKGAQKNFNLANFKNQNAPFEIEVKGFLGKSNRVEFYFKDYLNYMLTVADKNNTSIPTQKEAGVRKDALMDTTAKSFDFVVDASKSYEFLNQHRIKQSRDNAQLALSNNQIQNDNSTRNFQLDQTRQSQVNQITQSGQRAALDNTQATAWANWGVGAASGIANGIFGGVGINKDPETGAQLGLGFNQLGAGLGVASGVLNAASSAASTAIGNRSAEVALNISQNTANQALAANQGTNEQIFMNSLKTSQLIASNNYDNAIANIQAGLNDIKNQPDITAVSGSDYNFEMAWDNDDIYSIIYTTHPQALISIAQFFAQFGYAINRYDRVSDYLFVRKSFSYVKTKGANIKGRGGDGDISNKWRNVLNMIFDNGITFWMDKEKMAAMDITGNVPRMKVVE